MVAQICSCVVPASMDMETAEREATEVCPRCNVMVMLGSILHREQRAEILARFSEALLALSQRPATLGLAWLGGGDPRTLATRFNAVVYGRALTASEVDALIGGAHSMQPQRGYS